RSSAKYDRSPRGFGGQRVFVCPAGGRPRACAGRESKKRGRHDAVVGSSLPPCATAGFESFATGGNAGTGPRLDRCQGDHPVHRVCSLPTCAKRQRSLDDRIDVLRR
ncbi:unnamed protein product, partial [Ixodes hexagonus]